MAQIYPTKSNIDDVIGANVDKSMRDALALVMTREYIAHEVTTGRIMDDIDERLEALDQEVAESKVEMRDLVNPVIDSIVLGLLTTLLLLLSLVATNLINELTAYEGIMTIVCSAIGCSFINLMLLYRIAMVNRGAVHVYDRFNYRFHILWATVRSTIETVPTYGTFTVPDYVYYVDDKFFGGRLFHIEPEDQLIMLRKMIDYRLGYGDEDNSEPIAEHFSRQIDILVKSAQLDDNDDETTTDEEKENDNGSAE